MAILNMIMPKKGNEITVKIVKAPYKIGNDVYCDVKIFGDMARNTYRMKFAKSFWLSLHDSLKVRFFWDINPDASIDKNLECTVGKIFTISAIADPNRTFADKLGNQVGAKAFKVRNREELEQVELEGGDAYNQALQTEVVNNVSCHDCYTANMSLADAEEQKAKEREEKKKKKEEASKKLKKLDEYKTPRAKQIQGQIYPDPSELWS